MSQPKLRMLVVDDNASDRSVVRALVFKMKPKFIHEAENGTVAEGKLKTAADMSTPYDIVILDWNMPGTNGLKLLQQMRASTQLKATKVIVMTATAAREVVEAAIKHGADDFIVKPIDGVLLRQKIEKLTAPPAPSKPPGKPT